MQLLERNAATADDKADLVRFLYRESAAQRGADADGGRRLAQQFPLQKQQLHTAENIRIFHVRKAVGVCRHVREADIARDLRDERIRDRALLLDPHRTAGAQALRIARERSWLRTENTHARRERLDRRGHAANEAAAADRHDDRVDLRTPGKDLKPNGALPCHDRLVIKRRHHRRAPLGTEPRRDRETLGRIAQHELRAQRADGRLFDGRGRLRHDDTGVCAEALCGISHRAAVVAGRCRDKAACALRVR